MNWDNIEKISAGVVAFLPPGTKFIYVGPLQTQLLLLEVVKSADGDPNKATFKTAGEDREFPFSNFLRETDNNTFLDVGREFVVVADTTEHILESAPINRNSGYRNYIEKIVDTARTDFLVWERTQRGGAS